MPRIRTSLTKLCEVAVPNGLKRTPGSDIERPISDNAGIRASLRSSIWSLIGRNPTGRGRQGDAKCSGPNARELVAPQPAFPKNFVLSRLVESDFALLEPHLDPVDLPVRKVLERRGRPIKTIYFLDSGIASIVANGGKRLCLHRRVTPTRLAHYEWSSGGAREHLRPSHRRLTSAAEGKADSGRGARSCFRHLRWMSANSAKHSLYRLAAVVRCRRLYRSVFNRLCLNEAYPRDWFYRMVWTSPAVVRRCRNNAIIGTSVVNPTVAIEDKQLGKSLWNSARSGSWHRNRACLRS